MPTEAAPAAPYPVAEFDTIELPCLLVVREEDALYIRESVSDDAETLATTTFLFLQWGYDTMREAHGAAAALALRRALMHGLNQPGWIGEGDAE